MDPPPGSRFPAAVVNTGIEHVGSAHAEIGVPGCAPGEVHIEGGYAVKTTAIKEIDGFAVKALDAAAEGSTAPLDIHAGGVERFCNSPVPVHWEHLR